jgi:multiple sugar transport system substrate-binding protein
MSGSPRSSLAVAGVLAGALLGLTGCGGEERPADAGGETVSIRLQVSGEPEETKVYAALAQAYERAHRDVRVQVVEVASKGDHLARLSTSFAAGDPPDVFLVNYREYSQFVARGAVAAIEEPLAERDVDLSAYYDQPVEAFTYDGELQCMPQNISSLVVYYNRAVFADAGVPEPADDWTWDDFATTARRLTGGDVRGAGIDASIIRLAPFVWSNGGEIVDDESQPTRLTLDDDASREAVQDVVDLVREGAVPTEEELAAQDLQTRFVTGKLGMLLSSRREVPPLREVAGLDFDVAPVPRRGEPSTILHSDAYCLAAKADNQEAAADFVAFATGEQGQRLTALSGRTVPSLRAVAESPAFLNPAQAPARSQVFLDGIAAMRRTPVVPVWPEVEDIVEEQMTRAFYDEGASLDAVLAEIDRRTRPVLARGI